MKKQFSFLSIFLCGILLNTNFCFSQISTEFRFSSPLQNGITQAIRNSDINLFTIAAPPEADQSKIISTTQSGESKKLVFGENITTNISLLSCKWVQIKDKRICKIQLSCPGAKTLNLRLTDFNLTKGSQLFLYNREGTVVMGPVTESQNNKARIFLSSIFPGENLMLELIEDTTSKSKSSFTLSRITYGIVDTYKGILKDVGTSGSCEQNITCFLGAWHDEAKSAVRLLINGNTLCSACLVNNTAQDGTPYVLTANHCIVGEPDPENDVSFVFFFRSKYCDSTKPTDKYKVYNGCYVRAHYYNSDFALLEMANHPDSSENYFYSGWSRDTMQGSFAACLHFPQGDLMKFSESTLPPIDTAYGTSPDKNKMFWIRWTGSGVTEDASSGGPLFNADKQIIGQLYDGPSYCGATGDDKSDYFGGFFASWNGGGKITNRLKDWLDPLHTKQMSLNGAYIFNTENASSNKTISEIPQSEMPADAVLFPNPAKDILTLQIPESWFTNKSLVNIATVFSVEGKKMFSQNITSSSTQLNIAMLSNGIYIIQINNSENKIIKKLMVNK